MPSIPTILLSRQHPGGLPPGDPNDGVAANVATIIGVSVFSIVLAVVAVGLRFICRLIRKMPLKADDWFCVAAAVITLANASAYIWAIKDGFGKHIYVLEESDLYNFFLIVYITFQFYGGAVSMVKFSVLLFYERAFGKSFRKWTYALGALSIIWWIALAMVLAFQCSPIRAAWDPTVQGTCIPYLDITIGLQVANIVLDIAILCLPISAVMGLQMSKAKKWSVAGTFALAGLSIIFAIVRLGILISDKKQTDITFATPTASWSLVECAFELFCACIPCYTPFLKAGGFMSKIRSTFSSSYAKKSQGDSTGNSSRKMNTVERNNFQRIGNPAQMEKKGMTSSTNSLVSDEYNHIPLGPVR